MSHTLDMPRSSAHLEVQHRSHVSSVDGVLISNADHIADAEESFVDDQPIHTRTTAAEVVKCKFCLINSKPEMLSGNRISQGIIGHKPVPQLQVLHSATDTKLLHSALHFQGTGYGAICALKTPASVALGV
mmetsp:Transcript_44154/g.116880  ORF Transcript_44154/g.116880 Transcript_44154/m.116880 type:complete len:131 (-) Transcript_44154:1575-1967(-)